jgi:hypothetical protein
MARKQGGWKHLALLAALVKIAYYLVRLDREL